MLFRFRKAKLSGSFFTGASMIQANLSGGILGAAGHYSAHGGAVVLNAQDHFFRPALFN
jgi:uncharacterized protein YjbI with pentapeptide repeats